MNSKEVTNAQVPLVELTTRMARFRAIMDATTPDWKIVVVFSKINIYYLTGTMQDGMVMIPRDEEAVFWVRRSYERALDESVFPSIKPMDNFRSAAASIKALPETVHLETELVPLAHYQRFQKYFPFKNVRSADAQLGAVRSVKSPYELSLMERAGEIHRLVMEERLPAMLREGISEADLAGELFKCLITEGHHGVARFGMFQTDVVLGHIAFGESSLYPTAFNGPGGNYGLCPAVPMMGHRDRKLKDGDLVFIDIGCGVEGYHTDVTMTYVVGSPLPDEAVTSHNQCVDILKDIASQLKPGVIPSDIYINTLAKLSPQFLDNFMGYGNRRVKFLGHGIGLLVDEVPVIAEGFDYPLQENMVLAVEPKKGIQGVGMVGIEHTFVVTPQGGRCITGTRMGLIPVALRK